MRRWWMLVAGGAFAALVLALAVGAFAILWMDRRDLRAELRDMKAEAAQPTATRATEPGRVVGVLLKCSLVGSNARIAEFTGDRCRTPGGLHKSAFLVVTVRTNGGSTYTVRASKDLDGIVRVGQFWPGLETGVFGPLSW